MEQLARLQGELKARLEDRIKRVRTAYDERSGKLSRAWGLAKEAWSN